MRRRAFLKGAPGQRRAAEAASGGDEPERYELREAPPYRFELDRREFVGALGVGVIISLTAPAAFPQERPRGRQGQRGQRGGNVADRLHIGVDNRITLLVGKVEVGQGARTQLAMAAAEELRVAAASIQVVMADSLLVPDDGGTSGSRTTPSTVPDVRRAAAAAREALLEAAAAQWGVERSTLELRDGRITSAAAPGGATAGRSATLGEVVEKHLEGRLDREVDPGVPLTPVPSWKVLGTSAPKLGGEALVTGAHRYPSDITRPGMLHGVILRPPAFGATLESIDLASAKALAGVIALRDGDLVGFAAPTSFEARTALEQARSSARWTERPQSSSESLFERLKETARERGGGRSGSGGRRDAGDPGAAGPAGGREPGAGVGSLRSEYRIAPIQHAPLEPRAAVAEWVDGQLTVWTGTQNPGRVRGQVAEALRVPIEKVRLIVPDTGGGFGGKHTGEVAIEAARLAREAGRPVSLRWTREEELTWAYFRPAGVIELEASLGPDGRVVSWEQVNYNSGGSALETPYRVAGARARFVECEAPLRQGSYRALASTANIFARESFMDELAAVAGAEPLAFRLRHLDEGRLRAVLERAASQFGWERRRAETAGSRKRGLGLACGTEKGSYTAACVEVEITTDGGADAGRAGLGAAPGGSKGEAEGPMRYRVVEVCQAFECGALQNPANVRAQVEGCILQGLGGALREEVRFREGKVLTTSFSSYRVPRFCDVPRIEVHLVDRPDLPSVGAGETPIVAVAPAIGNALFAATGRRLRSLPLRDEALRSL